MLWEILLVGTVWFWLPLIIVGIVLSEMVDNDNVGGATALAIMTGVAIILFSDITAASLLGENLYTTLAAVVGYFIAGTGWAVAKWWFWLRRAKRKLDEIEARVTKDFPPRQHEDDETYGRRIKMELHYAWDRAKLPTEFPIAVSDHKGKIIGWMAFWPCSLLWTLINDPVRNAFEAIYDRIGTSLQRMSDRVFADRIEK